MTSPIESLMSEAMKNIKGMVDVNTIVGDVVTTDDGTTIIPISRVAFGFGAGGSEFGQGDSSKKFGGGSGAGVSINPVAFLIVNKDHIRLLPVDTTMSTVDRVIDVIPEVVSKFNRFLADRADKKQEKAKEKENQGYAQVQSESESEK